MAHIANNVVTRTEDQSVGKIPSSMDIFCNYVKDNESINYDDEDVKDATKAVDILLKRLIKAMGEDYPEFHVEELRLCGSMAEQTRIKEPGIFLEFDYLAVMKTWPGCGELQVLPIPNCSASSRIKFDVQDEESTPGKRDFLTTSVADTFLFHLHKCIQNRCEKLLCPQSFLNRKRFCFQYCRFCCVYIGNGRLRIKNSCRLHNIKEFHDQFNTLRLEWSNKLEDADSYLPIYVDLNPIFWFEQNNIDRRFKHKPLFLIPKTVRTCECEAHYNRNNYDDSLFMRISTHEDELKLIRNASFSHRVAFTAFKYLIKFLSHEINDGGFITQHLNKYSLKNIFLDHLQKCGHKRRYMAGGCLQRMIRTLLRCHNRYSTPHFQLKYNTSGCSLYCSDDAKNCYSTEQTRRYHREVGLILKACFDILTQPNIHDNFEDIRKDLQIFLFIFGVCRLEQSKTDFKSAPTGYMERNFLSLIPFKLSELLSLRQTMSASDAQHHYAEKCRLFSDSLKNKIKLLEMLEVMQT